MLNEFSLLRKYQPVWNSLSGVEHLPPLLGREAFSDR